MKLQPLLVVMFCLAVAATGADRSPAKPAVANADLSAFKTADELWAHIEKLQQQPTNKPKSREEAVEQITAWLNKQQAAAESFLTRFPADKRKWDARLIIVRTKIQRRQMTPGDAPLDKEKEGIEEILAAPDASEENKGEAGFLRLMLLTNDFNDAKPETFAGFHKAAGEWLGKYGAHKLAPQVRMIQLQVLSSATTPESETLLAEIAAGNDPQASAQARELLTTRKRTAELRTHPLELKFTATNGTEVDLEKMRGKVILVDFWASWCGPCIGELPNVVATYKKLHDQGFEIVGISLDEDQGKMEEATKKLNMTWPQHFDGGGWQNKISTSFGIRSIPAAWLLDKKGMLRETNLRGEALGTAVEKLLAD
jgi:thiol-disulfide isomerase/thioredoxin